MNQSVEKSNHKQKNDPSQNNIVLIDDVTENLHQERPFLTNAFSRRNYLVPLLFIYQKRK